MQARVLNVARSKTWLPWRTRSCVPCRDSSVCPKGADYQWGKDPLEQLMLDSIAIERRAWVTRPAETS